MRIVGIISTSAMLGLAACGGGGGGGGGSSTPIATAPTPTPSPSASPTAPPISPSSYDIAFDLTREREFQLFGAEIIRTFNNGIYEAVEVKLLDLGALAYARYVAATRATTISIFNVASDTYTSPVTQSSNAITYGDASSVTLALFKVGPSLGGLRAEQAYAIGVNQSGSATLGTGGTRFVDRHFVGGMPTVVADIPASGTPTYATILSEYGLAAGANALYIATAQSGGFKIDFATRSVTASIASKRNQEPATTTTLNFDGGFVGESSQIAGTVSTSDGGVGRWAGRLFGPSGRELAIAFTYARGATKVIGTAEATLNP